MMDRIFLWLGSVIMTVSGVVIIFFLFIGIPMGLLLSVLKLTGENK